LLRLVCDDPGFGLSVSRYLHPHYFTNEILAWAYHHVQLHIQTFDTVPSLKVLVEKSRSLDPNLRPLYTTTMESVREVDLRDEAWVRDSTVEFIRENLFVRAYKDIQNVWNGGDHQLAYKMMMESAEEIRKTRLHESDRLWLYDELSGRQSERLSLDFGGDCIPTGLPWLDHIMDGGPVPGELCAWIAYAKTGKSTMLVNHGKAATRVAYKNVIHFVFEGLAWQVATRYDASFSEELYRNIKYGDMDAQKYQLLQSEYKMLQRKMVVKPFLDRWDYSVVDIHQELKELEREHQWRPDLIIVDYGDLLTGRDVKGYPNETAKQRAAWRDLKSLANRGYVVWTASQAQRPNEDAEVKPHLIRARQVADCYDKVRVADFLGSLNQTVAEQQAKVMRVFAELYRDGAPPAQPLLVRADMSRMLIKAESGLTSPSIEALAQQGMARKPVQIQAPL